MLLFACKHIGFFNEVVALRFTEFKDEKAILMTSDLFVRSDYAEEFIKNGVFEYVFEDKINIRKNCDGEEDALSAVVSYYDELLKSNGYTAKSFSHVLIWTDVENLFSVYLSVKGVPHTLVEAEKGQFKKFERYTISVKFGGYKPVFEAVHRKYFALCGEGGTLISRILWDESDKVSEKDSVFDFSSSFFKLQQDKKELLLSCFKLTDLYIKDRELFLLNSAGYSNPKTKLENKNYYLPYQIMIDYLDHAEIMIKGHPQSSFDFKKAFPAIEEVPSLVPIEFFVLSDSVKIKAIYSVMSTGGDKIVDRVESVVKLGDAFLFEFRLLHRLFAAYSLVPLVCNDRTNFHYYAIQKQLIENFGRYMCGDFCEIREIHGVNPEILTGNIFTFIGEDGVKYCEQLRKALLNASHNMKAVFLDKKSIPFSIQESMDEILPFIVPLRIQKSQIGETISDLEDEYIYFYCKDAVVREKIWNAKAEKVLKNTGIRVSVEAEAAELSVLEEYARAAKINMLTEEVSSLRAEVKALTQKMEAMVGFFKTLDKGE